MDSRRLHCLLAIALALPFASALECRIVEGLPDDRQQSKKTLVCQPDEVCYEYEGSAHSPPVFRLVYYSGCGAMDICSKNLHTGNCTVCSTDMCNNALIKHLRSNNRACYSYFSSYDSIGAHDLSTSSVLCPTEERECFQVHFPAGSAYSAWTQFTGGCGSAKAGCTREFNSTKCTVCSENLCNAPSLPAFGSHLAGDDPLAVGTRPAVSTVSTLALALVAACAAALV